MATINLPFAASASRRIPTSGELADGYSCGPLDRGLDNWLEWWVTGQIKEAMAGASVAVDDTDLTRLSKAIASMAADGQCRLGYVSATQIRLDPYRGNLVRVAGAAVAIPSAGITAANSSVLINGVSGTLANSTTYLVALNSAGALEFWTLATGHSADTTAGNVGVEIITGQPTKSLVGMIHTTASGQFADNATNRLTLSWFNRRNISGVGPSTSGATTTSISVFVELTSSARVLFLTWGDESTSLIVAGQASNGTSAQSVAAGVWLDSAFAGISGGSYTAAGGQASYTGGTHNAVLAEGSHIASCAGAVGAGGTGTFAVVVSVNLRG